MRITSKEYKDAQLNLNKIMSDIAEHMEMAEPYNETVIDINKQEIRFNTYQDCERFCESMGITEDDNPKGID